MVNRNYEEDYEDDDDGTGGPVLEQSTNKRMGFGGVSSAVSPPQRLGLNNRTNEIDERWKD